MTLSSTIPVIDLEPVGHGGNARAAVVSEIDAACRDVGFFAVVGHLINETLRQDMLAAGRSFFALDAEEKQGIAIEQSDHHRCYAGIGQEQLQPDLPGDAKETLDFGIERSIDDPGRSPLEGPNQWPDLVGFRDVVERYQRAALAFADLVLGLIARALDLPPEFFRPALVHPLLGTRLVHYPSVSEQELTRQLGCGAHSDYGCITLLSTDGTQGLQLLHRDDTWIDVDVPAGALVVNLGDLLGRWTNDVYRSTKHRVISPSEGHRYSVRVFVDPAHDTLVTCLPSCVAPDRPARYEPVRAGDYLQSRFDDTFAYSDAD